MAGLATAALMAKSGKSVCIMDPAGSAGGCIAAHEIAGFRFTAGPAITYGFEQGGVLEQLYADLGLSAGAVSSFPGYQVVMPEHRITVSSDPRETLEELIREFPDRKSDLTRLYREVYKISDRSSKNRLASYISRQRNAAAYLQSYRFGKSLYAYFDVQSHFFFGSSLRRLPLASLVLMLTSPPHYLPGGFTLLADRLISMVQQLNGDWFHDEPYPELLLRSNRITGIRTSRGDIEPRTVLLNGPGEQSESVRFLGIRDEVIPVGMLSNVICLDDDDRPDAFYTFVLSPADEGMSAPAGMRSLTATFTPALPPDQAAESCVSRLTPVVPFLQNYLVTASPQDSHERRFPIPSTVTVKSPEFRQGRPMFSPCSVKNLKIIRDSVRTLVPAVYTAQVLAKRLK